MGTEGLNKSSGDGRGRGAREDAFHEVSKAVNGWSVVSSGDHTLSETCNPSRLLGGTGSWQGGGCVCGLG